MDRETQFFAKERGISERIAAVLSEVFGGAHHVEWPRVRKECRNQASYCTRQNFATFDGDLLTRLVLAAHAHAVRVELMPGGPNRIKLWMSERGREGSMFERHPTLLAHLTRLSDRSHRDELAAADLGT